jgi:hypothetical protein
MKIKILSGILTAAILVSLFYSCESKNEGTPPEIPPYESMVLDFSKFTTNQKSAMADTTKNNYYSSVATVIYWNTIITVTMIVPVASFYESFNHEPIFLGNATWQWTYDVNILGATYSARMTGQIRADDIKWEMFISKTGIEAHSEFKWFEGTSNLDGEGGQWLLYHSYDVQEAVLKIDWEKSENEIGSIKYTYIRNSDNGDAQQLSMNSYLQYGLKEEIFNAFYNIHSTTRDKENEGFLNVKIEWSTTEYFGKIMAEHYFNDSEWHCWDSEGYDAICE